MLNIRGTDGRFSNPDRDVRWAYQDACRLLVRRFNEGRWPQLIALVEEHGGTWDSLCDTCEAYTKFLASCCDEENVGQPLHVVLKRSGFLDQNLAEQVAVMAMLGTVCTGILFYGIRETNEAAADVPGMRALMLEAAEAMKVAKAHPFHRRANHEQSKLARLRRFFFPPSPTSESGSSTDGHL